MGRRVLEEAKDKDMVLVVMMDNLQMVTILARGDKLMEQIAK